MLRTGTQDSYIRNRINMPTARSHAELAQMDPKIRAQSFFSARVAEAHILDRLREVSDRYSRGEIGLGEARNLLKDFLKAEGYDPHKAGLKKLASTARLNLVMRQNAAMANAAAEWKRMHDPDAMKIFPYVRYHARKDSRSRDGHKELDGKIFHKDDPFLKTHTPPWEFNCRCWLEEITAKEAGREPEKVQEPTPPEDVTIDSTSGFSFDPEHAFETFDLASVKDVEKQQQVRAGIVQLCAEENAHLSLRLSAEIKPTVIPPKNLDEVESTIKNLQTALDAGVPVNQLPDDKLLLGTFTPGYLAEREIESDISQIVFYLRGTQDHGTKHWIKNHRNGLTPQKFIELLKRTVWNTAATCVEDVNGSVRRLVFEDRQPNGNAITTIFELKGNGEWALVDSWDPPTQYLDAQAKKRLKNKGDRRS